MKEDEDKPATATSGTKKNDDNEGVSGASKVTSSSGDVESQPQHSSSKNNESNPLLASSFITSSMNQKSLNQKSLELVLNEKTLSHALMALRFAVFSDAVNTTILQPNFPFLVLPGNHPDSFESTAPLGFSGATYFLPMTAFLGTAIASSFVGWLSDKQGRKPWILICLGVGAIGSIIKYLVRKSFWWFCLVNFLNGLFGATCPIAMAYVSDVKPTRKEKDAEIGVVIALNMIGVTGGGIVAILMQQDLFAPLFIGAGLSALSFFIALYWLVEPNKDLQLNATKNDPIAKEQEEYEASLAPPKLDWKVATNVLIGALADNFGSSGLVPICLSPLAFEAFYLDFLNAGEQPLMTDTAFKWLSVAVALMVIPGAACSQISFDKIGTPASCVLGNVITAIVTISLLYIALIEPASDASYIGFMVVLYLGFPMTVLSQLTTGPMMDALAPTHQRGFVQGLNVTVMALAGAVSPFLLGQLADSTTVDTTIWICVGVSFGAALINLPLVFVQALKRPPKLKPQYSRALKGEDDEIIETALRGEWVPARYLHEINKKRFDEGKQLLMLPWKPYEEDKENLLTIQRQAREDFQNHKETLARQLKEFDTSEKREEVVEKYLQLRPPEDIREELKGSLGQWFTDYIVDSGYAVEDSPILYKQMIIRAFPPLREPGEELTAENLQQILINSSRVVHSYLGEEEPSLANQAFARKFARGASALAMSSSSSSSIRRRRFPTDEQQKSNTTSAVLDETKKMEQSHEC